MPNIESSPDATAGGAPDLHDERSVRDRPRHSRVTRIAHWLNAWAMAALFMSGLQILNAHPALYWGQAGFDKSRAWIQVGDDGSGAPHGFLHIGATTIHTTGFLGAFSTPAGLVTKAFPGWLTIPSERDLAVGRRWHFLFSWVLVVNGFIYLTVSIATGHLRRDLIPTLRELTPRRLGQDIWNHLRLRFPRDEAARHYNTLQKLAYVGVILGLGPLMILTGLTMSPGFDAAVPGLLDLFGGRQSARSIHFITANLLLLFLIVHLGALLAVGVWNELRSMITGRYARSRGA